MTPRRKGRLMLLLLVVVFSLPVVIGLYLYTSGYRMGGQSHGQLLHPPQKLTAHMTMDWQGKWRLVYVTAAGCTGECSAMLHRLRQLHASMAKDIDRLQRVWVIDGKADEEVVAPLRRQYPDLLIMNDAHAVAMQFSRVGGVGDVFLVDPLGNLMMRYPAGAEPSGIRKDLVRLLTYSWTG